MTRLLRKLADDILLYDPEQEKLNTIVAQLRPAGGTPWRLLDVGCGYARHLRRFAAAGIDSTGVDANPRSVEANIADGLRCMTPEAFNATQEVFDVIVMSHVIEHFAPEALKEFLEHYLDRLKPGGHLVIATPLMSDYFYDDFDHVKPYQPTGLLAVFGRPEAQVQYQGRHALELEDLWFRRAPWRVHHRRSRYFRTSSSRVWQVIELTSALLFRATGGRLGRPDGWVGLFRKVSP